MATVIDAHHHLWKYDPAEYPWIGPSAQVLRKDFLPADLKQEMSKAGVDGAVSVQARQSLVETNWLLDLAEQNDFMRGVVGWAPLADKNVAEALVRLAPRKKLKGVRHVLQDEADEFMEQADFNAGIKRLHEFGLRYDILIYEKQLPAATKLVDRHPGQVFVLDHIAKPRIREGEISPWRENLREMAKRPNVYCKLSGMATEADPKRWTFEQLRPYADVALEAFGPRRLMFGSDWPVLRLAAEYGRWKQVAMEFAKPLSSSEQARFLGETAVEAYAL